MSETSGISRRGFMKTALAAAAGATAATTGIHWWQTQKAETVISTLPNPLSSLPHTPIPVSSAQTDQLFSQLVTTQAENLHLQTELAAAHRQIAQLQNQQPPMDLLQTMQGELDQAHQQTTVLAGLVSLYEQLEQTQLDEAVQQGLTTVQGAFSNFMQNLPTVRQALEAGQQALAELESQIPFLESGRQWLGQHLTQLTEDYNFAEAVLTAAVEQIGNFLEMVLAWFQGILKWLPFGLGDQAAQVVAALTKLLGETPNTIAGLRVNVSQPLDLWLAEEEGKKRIHSRLIAPVRERTIVSANGLLVGLEELQANYEMALNVPAQTTLHTRRLLRQQIEQYRTEHQL